MQRLSRSPSRGVSAEPVGVGVLCAGRVTGRVSGWGGLRVKGLIGA